MDLLEYQAKALFREVGIPVLPSQQVNDPRDLKQLHIPYPIVLKSQVHAGGRGQAGGIRFVENTIDAIAAARTIFNLPIMDKYPQVLLAEARYDTDQECFLAIVFDYLLGCPVLLGSSRGGMQVETVLEQMQKIVLQSEFSPFYARKLAVMMGLEGQAIASVSEIIVRMYRLFTTKDLNSIEINPLGINAAGEVMALDGKITIDDRALGRQGEVLGLLDQLNHNEIEAQDPPQVAPPDTNAEPTVYPLDVDDAKGNIGILSSSAGLGMLAWDLLCDAGGKPACCWIIAPARDGILDNEADLADALAYGLAQLQAVEGIDRILIHCLSDTPMSTAIAKALVTSIEPPHPLTKITGSEERAERPTASQERSQRSARERSTLRKKARNANSSETQFIVRSIGVDWEAILTGPHPTLYWTEDLSQAIAQTVSRQ
ncbi:MAG: ATP-grasp domain-containing protein [Jaaginema sp. PMC 1079.18]|nr:ATP-grasp domain-containing protein [Jaaginema sp. PMC 1080.18]MEC4849901.1 ATP-grasp domain-containing protein [Jaaginema sp. PMC 1079.18]MEC4865986.1 ATP-grasp domain-containing protein [Jaaginema sp. PMC 1078.18]